jgi:hypothetical protein
MRFGGAKLGKMALFGSLLSVFSKRKTPSPPPSNREQGHWVEAEEVMHVLLFHSK